MTVLEKVTAIVAEVLEVEPEDVAPEANLVEELEMDSVLGIDIATAVEKHYKVRVPDEQMERLISVQAIVSLVEELLAKRDA